MVASEITGAVSLHAAGRLAEAEAVCLDVLTRDPGSVEARCALSSFALQQAGAGMKSSAWLHQACALQPDYPPAHYYLAIQRGDRGDIVGMRSSARRARLLLDPASGMAGSLEVFAAAWRWLDAARPPSIRYRKRREPRLDNLEWLFVWRDLGELFFHFDRSKSGTRHTIWLPSAQSDPRVARVTEDLIHQVEYIRPDVVAFLPGTAGHRNPDIGAFHAIRQLGIPTILIVPDLRKQHWVGIVSQAAAAFDLIVSLDGCPLKSLPALRGLGDRFFRGWAPISSFSPLPFDQRPIGVNLVGSLWGPRVTAANALTAAGIEIVTRPPIPQGPRERELPAHKTLSNDGYFDLLRRSRLSINLSACSTGDGHQLKARVFEAAASGAMIIESANELTRDYFEEGREFVYFSDNDDLITKVRHYLAHPEEAATIAAAAHARFLASYEAPGFWRTVYDHAKRQNSLSLQLPLR
jgi:hypothetical protein